MTLVPKFPKKVQHLLSFSFPAIRRLCRKTPKEQFVGGRKGYDREFLFALLLVKKATNWSYRTVAEMGEVSHSTLVGRLAKLFSPDRQEPISLKLASNILTIPPIDAYGVVVIKK